MKLKLDENLGHRWSDILAGSGHDVDTVYEERLSGMDDSTVLDAAIAAGRALITLDLDFANPFRFPPGPTSGIAVLRVQRATWASGRRSRHRGAHKGSQPGRPHRPPVDH